MLGRPRFRAEEDWGGKGNIDIWFEDASQDLRDRVGRELAEMIPRLHKHARSTYHVEELVGHIFHKMSRAGNLRGYSQEYRDKLSVSHGGVEFVVIDRETKKNIGRWKNQSACARDLGISQQQISKCLAGKRKSVGRYLFKRCSDA